MSPPPGDCPQPLSLGQGSSVFPWKPAFSYHLTYKHLLWSSVFLLFGLPVSRLVSCLRAEDLGYSSYATSGSQSAWDMLSVPLVFDE